MGAICRAGSVRPLLHSYWEVTAPVSAAVGVNGGGQHCVVRPPIISCGPSSLEKGQTPLSGVLLGILGGIESFGLVGIFSARIDAALGLALAQLGHGVSNTADRWSPQ